MYTYYVKHLGQTTPDCMTQLERIQSASSSSHCSHAPLLLVSGWLAGEGGVCRGVSRGPVPTRSVDTLHIVRSHSRLNQRSLTQRRPSRSDDQPRRQRISPTPVDVVMERGSAVTMQCGVVNLNM